jgi:predicted glycosyltransferase
LVRRLLMYSQDGHGLGHLRRSMNIAREVRARNPRCDVLIVADSPAVSIAGSEPGIELLKLPTIVKTGNSTWQNGALAMPVRRLVKLRSELLLHTAAEFRPNAIIVDHMPVGAMGELKAMLDYALLQPRPPRLFLGLRDVLDRPAVIRDAWERVGAYEYLPYYDAVMIYGDQSIYDSSTAYRLAVHAREIAYCNYVSPGRRGASLEPAAGTPLILMMGGGGADAFPLAESFTRAVSTIGQALEGEAVLLTGPNMAPRQRAHLASLGNVRVESSYRDATSLIRQASVIVTMGGYNSLCEVLTWQKKAVVVPRRGPSAEQQIRAKLFKARSLIRSVPPHALDAARLATELLSLLGDDEIPDIPGIPLLDGAQVAASLVLDRTRGFARRGNGVARAAGPTVLQEAAGMSVA